MFEVGKKYKFIANWFDSSGSTRKCVLNYNNKSYYESADNGVELSSFTESLWEEYKEPKTLTVKLYLLKDRRTDDVSWFLIEQNDCYCETIGSKEVTLVEGIFL